MAERLGGRWPPAAPVVRNYRKVGDAQPTQHRRVNRRVTWVDLPHERVAAGRTLSSVFAATFLLTTAVGALTLLWVPTADRDYENLPDVVDDLHCMRVARRADYPVIFVGLGSPIQYLKLALRLDRVVSNDDDAMVLFAERMHKSQTMTCTPFDPPIPYQEQCQDIGMVYNGTELQHYVRTRFTFQNDYVEASLYNRASLVGLDGYMHLVAGTTYWLTNTHLCFGPHQPETADSEDALPFSLDATGHAHATLEDLQTFGATAEAPVARADVGQCANLSYPDGIRLFPVDAISETNSWLSLSTNFLYEYGHNILELRREALEVGETCARNRSDLSHIHALYRIDCDIHYPYGWCQSEPALPFRRLAQSRLRIDVAADGTGTLRAAETEALARIPHLVSYGEALGLAFARLLIMLLTAAVVFIRGNQNASSSPYMLEHVLNTVRCRGRQPGSPNDFRWAFTHDWVEILVDVVITSVALLSRMLVFAFAWQPLVSDANAGVIVYELVGIAASIAHISMRYCVLKCDLAREAPLTKLGGPMSICDVSAAVLLAFADPPLLSTDDGRFAAVGRLLIAILIAIQVYSRCAFAAGMCALLANTVINDRETYRTELRGYRSVLIVSTALWMLQAAACSASMCTLFVGPAAYTMTRMFVGDTTVIRFCLYFGLVAASLPTITKVALRTLEHECTQERAVEPFKQK